MSRKHRKTRSEKNRAAARASSKAVEQKAPETKETKREKGRLSKGPRVIIAISLTVVVLMGLLAGALWALGFSFNPDNWSKEVKAKNRYTTADFISKLSADTVVATYGDQELTNGVLQVYYSRMVWDVVDAYSSYLSVIGLDITKPLSQQKVPEGEVLTGSEYFHYTEELTWEQYFLIQALDTWRQQQTLVQMAETEEFQYPEGLQEFLDALGDSLDSQAAQNGYEDGNALVKKEMGASANVEYYKDYSEIYNKALEFYTYLYESMEPSESQVEAYYDANADMVGVEKTTNPVIDVRHILLTPQVDTEESKAVCLERAEELLQQWKDGEATQESFAQLAGEHSKDPGSNTTGGLYEFVYQGDMVDAFDAWCFDESRKPGDTGIVETEYGYHIMYFVYGADEWYRAAVQSMRSEMCQEMITAASDRQEFQVDYCKIVLSEIEFE